MRRTLLALALIALVPVFAAFAVRLYLSPQQRVFDEQMIFGDGFHTVTVLDWSMQPNGPLFVGTRAGVVMQLSRDGGSSTVRFAGDGKPVIALHAAGNDAPIAVVPDRGGADGAAIAMAGPWEVAVHERLFAAVPANNGSAIVGQYEGTGDTGSLFSTQLFPPAPSGRLRLMLYRDLNTKPIAVGEIPGIEDARVVAALPHTNIVIAGDGKGNLFAIDASAQIGGVSPTQYISLIGRHDSAIVEIAVSADPLFAGMRFATLASDRSIKVWGEEVDSPTIGYVSADVTPPGSAWVQEPTVPPVNGLRDLLSMNRNGRRVLVNRGTDLLIYDLPAPGVDAAVTVHENISNHKLDSPAILSQSGSRLLANNPRDLVVELIDLSNIGSQARPPPVIASFLRGRSVIHLAFDAIGDRFVAVSADGTIFLQSVSSPDSSPVEIREYSHQLLDPQVAISPDGTVVAVCTRGLISLYSTDDGHRLSQWPAFRSETAGAPGFDSNGRRVHVYNDDTTLLSTFSIRGPVHRAFPVPVDTESIKYSGDGKRFVGTSATELRVGDIDGQKEVGTIVSIAAGGRQWVTNYSASRIAVLDSSGRLRFFREKEDLTRPGPMPALRERALRLSADGRQLFAGTADGRLLFAQLINGRQTILARPVLEPILAGPVLDFASPSGGTVATARTDGSVSIADIVLPALLDSGEADANIAVRPTGLNAVATITGHGGPVQAMALSPDGTLLATASADGRLRITDLAITRLVAWLPISTLPTGPAVETMVARPLANSPYAPAAEGSAATPDPAWLKIARGEIGVREYLPVKGITWLPASNPRIEQYHASTTTGRQPQTVAWGCSFVSWVLQQANVAGNPRSARCADYRQFGRPLDEPATGAITVLSPQAAAEAVSGAAGFLVSWDDATVTLVIGNVNNQVGLQRFPRAQVRGYRWPIPSGG
ncbi:hypothetical protein [Mesorhizobium sp. M0478]|uniref:hypothetical protein n=1 Tax=Mesorhizobium sp. M0478 TaxID=2956947 RepID=UPI0033362AED